MTEKKSKAIYDVRKADRIMTFDQWHPAAQALNVEMGYKSFIIGGITALWAAANMALAYYFNNLLFINIAIYAIIPLTIGWCIWTFNISKRRHGINLFGVGAITALEVSIYKHHREANHVQPVE